MSLTSETGIGWSFLFKEVRSNWLILTYEFKFDLFAFGNKLFFKNKTSHILGTWILIKTHVATWETTICFEMAMLILKKWLPCVQGDRSSHWWDRRPVPLMPMWKPLCSVVASRFSIGLNQLQVLIISGFTIVSELKSVSHRILLRDGLRLAP